MTVERTIETSTPTINMVKMQACMNKVMGDLSAAVVSLVCALGDRLGLLRDLAAHGPSTSRELAARTGIDARYARGWLYVLASAGYLEYDPVSQSFVLPPEHALLLAKEDGMMYLGGAYQLLLGLSGPVDQLAEAFRHGGGVPQDAYDENLRNGMERMSAPWFKHLLVQQWIPSVPDVQTKLERGARVADIGCGGGQALINLAQAFTNSHFVGYDVFGPAIARATANAERAGVADRVRFEQLDVIDGLPPQYELVTMFNSLHDIVNPQSPLAAIRQALLPDGTYLLLETNCSDKLEDNIGPMGAIMYGTSVLYNMPVSIANGGDGMGTMGLPESRVRELCTAAGFVSVRRLPVMNPFHALYEIKP